MKDYQQQNIYIQNSIRSRHYDFSPAYSEMIGRLCAVESSVTMRDSSQGFAAELLSSFKGNDVYSKVDRVCLVLRVGLSNELFVVDSEVSPRVERENLMKPGYRCFVKPDSSLFAVREGDIRIYDDAKRIAEAFAKRRSPIQRSLKYVMSMDLNSGVCLPLHMNGQLAGFLFLNSVEEGLFSRLVDEDYAVLNIISMIAKLCLIKETQGGVDYLSLKAQGFAKFEGALFDEDEFAEKLQKVARWQTGELWRPNIKSDGNCNFLYSPATLAYSIVKICSGLYRSAAEFPKEILVSNADDFSIQVLIPVNETVIHPTLDFYRMRVFGIAASLGFLKIQVAAGINHVSLKFPFDQVSRSSDDVLYSV